MDTDTKKRVSTRVKRIAGQVAESKPEGLSSMAKRRKKGVSK